MHNAQIPPKSAQRNNIVTHVRNNLAQSKVTFLLLLWSNFRGIQRTYHRETGTHYTPLVVVPQTAGGSSRSGMSLDLNTVVAARFWVLALEVFTPAYPSIHLPCARGEFRATTVLKSSAQRRAAGTSGARDSPSESLQRRKTDGRTLARPHIRTFCLLVPQRDSHFYR